MMKTAIQRKQCFTVSIVTLCLLLVANEILTGFRGLRIRRCDNMSEVNRQRMCVLGELKKLKTMKDPVRSMKDAIDRCTYLLYTAVKVPYTIVLFRHGTELVFVLRPVKVLKSCESVLISPHFDWQMTNGTVDVLSDDFCRQKTVTTNVTALLSQTHSQPNHHHRTITVFHLNSPTRIIDHITLEGENIEFQLPSLFFKHGAMQKRHGVIVCQLHINFSNWFIGSNKMFHMVQQLAMLSNFIVTRVEYYKEHSMAYFLNFQDQECRIRYLTTCSRSEGLVMPVIRSLVNVIF